MNDLEILVLETYIKNLRQEVTNLDPNTPGYDGDLIVLQRRLERCERILFKYNILEWDWIC